MSRLPYRCRIALGRGQGCPAPLILDLTEALRAEQKGSRASRPLIAGSGRPFPPYLKIWISHCKVITDPLFAPFVAFFPWLSINYLIFKKGLQKTSRRLYITLHQGGGVDFLDTFFCPEGGGTSSGLIFGYSWVAEGLKPYPSLLRTKIKILNFITLFVQAIPSI